MVELDPLDGFGGKVELAPEFCLFAVHPELLGLSHQTALDHRSDELGFLVADGDVFRQPPRVDRRFVKLILTLVQARFQHRQLVAEIVPARHQQLLLVVADLRRGALDLLRAGKRLGDVAALLVLEPGYARPQRTGLGLLLSETGRTQGVVEPDDHVVLLDDLADLDRDLLDHAGLAGLDDLGLGSWNDLALAAGDLVHFRKRSPDDEGREKRSYDKHRRRCKKRRTIFLRKHPHAPSYIDQANICICPFRHSVSAMP